MMHFFRRIRLALCISVLLAVGTGEHLLCALLGAAWVACVTYAAGDAWLCERERRDATSAPTSSTRAPQA